MVQKTTSSPVVWQTKFHFFLVFSTLFLNSGFFQTEVQLNGLSRKRCAFVIIVPYQSLPRAHPIFADVAITECLQSRSYNSGPDRFKTAPCSTANPTGSAVLQGVIPALNFNCLRFRGNLWISDLQVGNSKDWIEPGVLCYLLPEKDDSSQMCCNI